MVRVCLFCEMNDRILALYIYMVAVAAAHAPGEESSYLAGCCLLPWFSTVK